MDVFITVPKAACFAVTFKLGRPEQMYLPGVGLSVDVIDELLTCVQLCDSSDRKALRGRLDDDAYYNSFVALVGKIAPDGEGVSKVVFSAVRAEGTKQAVLSKSPADMVLEEETYLEKYRRTEADQVVTVVGRLRFADSRTGKPRIVQLELEEGGLRRIKVPRGMMADIVKPMFESMVSVTGRPKGKSIELLNPEGIRELSD